MHRCQNKSNGTFKQQHGLGDPEHTSKEAMVGAGQGETGDRAPRSQLAPQDTSLSGCPEDGLRTTPPGPRLHIYELKGLMGGGGGVQQEPIPHH